MPLDSYTGEGCPAACLRLSSMPVGPTALEPPFSDMWSCAYPSCSLLSCSRGGRPCSVAGAGSPAEITHEELSAPATPLAVGGIPGLIRDSPQGARSEQTVLAEAMEG